MSFSFNLVDEAWIPCILPDGRTTAHLSIKGTLLRAHELHEVCDPSPLVTVSLHRLLLAVLYRALASVEDDQQWQELWHVGRFPPDRIRTYLDKWRDRFDLFSQERPFYQTAGLRTDRTDSLSRLATELCSGHNPTLFDHSLDDANREYSPAEAVRLLVAAQGYALGFGKSSRACIGDLAVEPPYSSDAILLRGVTVWLAGESAFETLLLNLVPEKLDSKDVPSWELEPTAQEALMDTGGSGARQKSRALGPVDRFTWQSRRVRLIPERRHQGTTVVCQLCFTQGRSADKSPYDPMKAYRRDERQGFVPVSLSAGKAAWRDLHALVSLEESTKRPASLNHAARMVRAGILESRLLHTVDVVGLATAPNKPGKFLLWRHDRMPVPAALLGDQDLMSYLAGAIQCAEDMAKQPWGLQRRMERVCRLFAAPAADRPGGRAPRREDIAPLLDSLNPQRSYWSRLEEPFYRFLQDLPDDPDGASECWLDAVETEARRSFREACRALGTSARAIRAVASASDYFRVPGRPEHEIAAEPTQPQERR